MVEQNGWVIDRRVGDSREVIYWNTLFQRVRTLHVGYYTESQCIAREAANIVLMNALLDASPLLRKLRSLAND
jgi:hypothetical protein